MTASVCVLGVLAIALAFGLAAAQAAPGTLDSSFGLDGVVTTPLNGGTSGRAVLVQPDGRIVVVGGGGVARYEPNGSLDQSFGSQGVAHVGGSFAVAAVVLQPDGKIVVVGGGYGPKLSRLDSDGSLDPSFGNGGTVQTAIGVSDVALQSDGKILVGGTSSDGSHIVWAVSRYNADGSLDTSFGNGGTVLAPAMGTSDSYLDSIGVQSDGKIVASGWSVNGQEAISNLVRFDADGSLDTSFGTGGIVTNSAVGEDSALALLPDGKIVAGEPAALARYNSDGSLDTSFGSGGVTVPPDAGEAGGPSALGVEPNGALVFAYQSSTNDFALARFNPDGSVDTGFGQSGIGTAPPVNSTEAVATSLALQPDGKVVVAGVSGAQIELARFSGAMLLVVEQGTGTGTVTSSPAGIACGSTCSAPFTETPVTLTASPEAGSVFKGWSGGGCSGTGTCQVQMSADQVVTATFDAAPVPSTPHCVVPNVRARSLAAAKTALEKADCRVGRITRKHSAVRKGRVISQRPGRGKTLVAGARVSLVVSSGRRR